MTTAVRGMWGSLNEILVFILSFFDHSTRLIPKNQENIILSYTFIKKSHNMKNISEGFNHIIYLAIVKLGKP